MTNSALIWLESYQLSGAEVAAAFGVASPNPGREPLAAVFRIAGQEITLINNHFKSNYIPETQTAETKKAAATKPGVTSGAGASGARVCQWAAGSKLRGVGAGGRGFEYIQARRRPGEFNGSGENFGRTGGGTAVNQLTPPQKDMFAYTFIWEGENEILDHMLVSPALLDKVVGVDVLHFNAGYPEALWLEGETAVRASDRDPLEARFQLRAPFYK
ncbi:MAG: hypothetical protein M5U34_49110 [Chloroflexi bacterium]|nr:hypothetical protein [Chloroflexota bacterium]